MNDCLCFAIGVCEGDRCAVCTHYLSLNDEWACEQYQLYYEEIENALIPVRERWKERLGLEES